MSECSIRSPTKWIGKSNNYILPNSASIPIFFLVERNLSIYQFPYPKILDPSYPSLPHYLGLVNHKMLLLVVTSSQTFCLCQFDTSLFVS